MSNPLFPKVTRPASSLRIESGIDKKTGRKVWTVDLIEEHGGATIGVAESFADVGRFVDAWEAGEHGPGGAAA